MIAQAGTVSSEEFLDAYGGTHAEWVDGEVHPVSPGNRRQSQLVRFLSAALQHWAEAHGLGETFVPPFTVRLDERTAREPDVFFVRAANRERVRDTFVDGAPDLVVEVVSPSSRGTDRGDKFYEYERAGVPEYWLVDPDRERVEAYRLGPDGTYAAADDADPAALRSDALPGLEIQVAWLWQDPPPRMADVLRHWGIT